jgi:hypothetical protein
MEKREITFNAPFVSNHQLLLTLQRIPFLSQKEEKQLVLP